MPTRPFSLFGRTSLRLRKHDHHRRGDDGHRTKEFNKKESTKSAPCSLESERRTSEPTEASKSLGSRQLSTSSPCVSLSPVPSVSAQVSEPVSELEPSPSPAPAATEAGTEAQDVTLVPSLVSAPSQSELVEQMQATTHTAVSELEPSPSPATATATEAQTLTHNVPTPVSEPDPSPSPAPATEPTQVGSVLSEISAGKHAEVAHQPQAPTQTEATKLASVPSQGPAQAQVEEQLQAPTQTATLTVGESELSSACCSSCLDSARSQSNNGDNNNKVVEIRCADRNEEDNAVIDTGKIVLNNSCTDSNQDELIESLLAMMKQERTIYHHLFTNEVCIRQQLQQQQQQPTLQSEQLNDCISDAQWRQRIIEWMYSVVDNCNLRRDSVAVSAYYLDLCLLYIQQQRLKQQKEKELNRVDATGTDIDDDNIIQINSRTEFQLCAMTALQLAIKLYDTTSLKLNCMVKLSRGAFGEKDVVQMEMKMLLLMKWHIHPPTTICFARQYLRFLFRHLEKQHDGEHEEHQLDQPKQQILVLPAFTRYLIIEITRFLSEISVCLSRFLKYPPSIIALACMLVAIEHVPTSPTTIVPKQQQQQQLSQPQQQLQHAEKSVANTAAAKLLILLHQRQEQCEQQHQQEQHQQQLLPLWYRQHIFDFLAQIIVIDDKDEDFSDNCTTHCKQLLEVFDDLQIYLESNERSLQELIHTITKE